MGSSAGLDHAYRMGADELNARLGGNTGNLAFVHAIARHLQGAQVVPWHVTGTELRVMADLVVIACANQLGPHVDLGAQANNLEAAGLPVIGLGLGAQAASRTEEVQIPPGTRRWLEVIAAHAPSDAPNIGVRGDFTLAQLERMGLGRRAAVIGCPSNFITLDGDVAGLVAARAAMPVQRVAAAVGQPHWPRLAEIERAMLDLVDATGGSCVVQHDLLMVRLGQGEFADISPHGFELLRSYFRPALDDEAFALWCRRTMLCFGNVPSWMRWLAQHDFVIGPRFHGLMLGIQAGIPAGCIAHDSRTAELCETVGIPFLDAEQVPPRLTTEALPELFPFDAADYRARRRRLAAAYAGVLRGAGVDFDPRLEEVAGVAGAAPVPGVDSSEDAHAVPPLP